MVAAVTVVALLAGALGMLLPATTASADDGGFATRMLALMNQQRAAAGVGALQWSATLGGIAADSPYTGCGFPVSGRATDMGVRNYFSHTILSCGTQSVFNVLSALGVQSSASGENIAWMSGTTDPLVAAERLMNDLMASPDHKANILNPDFNTVGLGSWHTSSGQTWTGGGGPLTNVYIGVQVFGHMATTTTTPPPPAAPVAPTNVQATGGDAAIAVSWTPAAGGPAVDSYGAFAWDSTGYTNHYVTVCATCTAGTVTGLTNGHQYYVTVYGHNGSGWGAPGYSNWVTVAAAPGAPTAVTVRPANGAMTGSWAAPTNAGTAIDGYGMFAFDANGYTNQYAWVCATCTAATVTGLVNGRSYYSVVYAHNPNGWGTPTVSGWVVAGTPGPAGNVSVAKGTGSVAVSWTPAANSGSAIDMYGIFAFDGTAYTGIYATGCPTCTSGTVTGLTSGKTYTIWVYAHNALGWGVPTPSSAVTVA
jgi:uncharacterized protein YkwD